MGFYRIQLLATVSLMLLLPNTQGWGEDGHAIVCKIAQVHSLSLSLLELCVCLFFLL